MKEDIADMVHQTAAHMHEVKYLLSAMFASHTHGEREIYDLFKRAADSRPMDPTKTPEQGDVIQHGARIVADDHTNTWFYQLPTALRSRMTRDAFKQGCNTQIEDDINEIKEKLEALRTRLESLGEEMEQQNKQLLRALEAGPHERITNEVCHHFCLTQVCSSYLRMCAGSGRKW